MSAAPSLCPISSLSRVLASRFVLTRSAVYVCRVCTEILHTLVRFMLPNGTAVRPCLPRTIVCPGNSCAMLFL